MPMKYTKEGHKDWRKTWFAYPADIPIARNKRIIVEIGPGRGDFLFHLAETNPDALVVAIEIKRKRVDKIIKRIERRGIKNIYLVQDDAREAMPRLFHDGQLDDIHIQFPDPWPKNRHGKNRSLSKDFLEKCRDILKDNAAINFVTDFKDYADAVEETAREVDGLKIEVGNDKTFPTFFAMKWKEMGRSFYSFRFEKAV